MKGKIYLLYHDPYSLPRDGRYVWVRDLCLGVFAEAYDHTMTREPRWRLHIRCDYGNAILKTANRHILLPWPDSRSDYSGGAEDQFRSFQGIDS